MLPHWRGCPLKAFSVSTPISCNRSLVFSISPRVPTGTFSWPSRYPLIYLNHFEAEAVKTMVTWCGWGSLSEARTEIFFSTALDPQYSPFFGSTSPAFRWFATTRVLLVLEGAMAVGSKLGQWVSFGYSWATSRFPFFTSPPGSSKQAETHGKN